MSLINMTMKHGRSLDEARAAMEQAVRDLQARFKLMIRRAEWAPDRNQVRVEGVGFWLEMKVDPQEVHVSGDVPILGGFLGSNLGGSIKQIMQASFDKALPGRTTRA